MKRLTTLITFALAAFFSTPSAQAAITHQTQLSGSDYEYITAFDEQYAPVYGFTSYGWTVDVLAYDDQEGSVVFTWYAGGGVFQKVYTAGPSLSSLTLIYGDNYGFTTAELAFLNYLAPF
jgi:hypothetical protein